MVNAVITFNGTEASYNSLHGLVIQLNLYKVQVGSAHAINVKSYGLIN